MLFSITLSTQEAIYLHAWVIPGSMYTSNNFFINEIMNMTPALPPVAFLHHII
jgi:hypothetical protein